MTGEPPPPTQTIPPGTPDEKLTLLIATLLDIILTILEALPIPGFLRRPLQNRARHECAALLTRLLATRVPAPATTPEPAQTPQPPPESRPTIRAGLGTLGKPSPTGPIRLDHQPQQPPSEPIDAPTQVQSTEPDTTQPPRHRRLRDIRIDHPTRARPRPIPGRPPAPKFQKSACAATQTHAHFVTISKQTSLTAP